MWKVASLFSGVGGMDFGFLAHPSYQVVFANDFNKDAAATYRLNHEADHFCEGDIKDCFDDIPPHDVLIGGFPCQPFSLAGKRLGFDDPRGLELLSMCEVMRLHKPKAVIAENVKGFLSHNKGETMRDAVTCLQQEGYRVQVELVKCETLGIPQKRHRVLLVCWRNDISNQPFHLPLANADTLDMTIGHLPHPTESQDPMHNLHTPEVKLHWMKVLCEGENLAKLSEATVREREAALGLLHKDIPRSFQGYVRLKGSEVAPTMAFGNTCLPIHPHDNRSISVREAALIQTFPSDFVFCGGTASQYKQIGNAVPPKLSKLLAEALVSCLSGLE